MLKAAKDSVIEVAPPGIASVQLVRMRSRRQLDLNISECREPGSDVFYQLEAGSLPVEGKGAKKLRHHGRENFL